MKQSLKKRLNLQAGRNAKPLTSLENIPAESWQDHRQESRESSSRIGYI
ncbi:MAG: hypothetical protein V7K32_26560 [Nostoc sp.]